MNPLELRITYDNPDMICGRMICFMCPFTGHNLCQNEMIKAAKTTGVRIIIECGVDYD
jgi:hypothetical protein